MVGVRGYQIPFQSRTEGATIGGAHRAYRMMMTLVCMMKTLVNMMLTVCAASLHTLLGKRQFPAALSHFEETPKPQLVSCALVLLQLHITRCCCWDAMHV